MGDTPQEYRSLTREELNALAGEELPERAAMSLLNANIAAPINAAVAANILSDHSAALADATGDVLAPAEAKNCVAFAISVISSCPAVEIAAGRPSTCARMYC